jgi:hypothetical protein
VTEPIRQPVLLLLFFFFFFFFFFVVVVVVVDEDPATVEALTGHLERRIHAGYRAVGETSAAAALQRLAASRHPGDQVALR